MQYIGWYIHALCSSDPVLPGLLASQSFPLYLDSSSLDNVEPAIHEHNQGIHIYNWGSSSQVGVEVKDKFQLFVYRYSEIIQIERFDNSL